MTTISLRDPKADSVPAELPPLPIGSLAVATCNLLDEAAGLPQPRFIDISDTQHIGLQFAPDISSVRAMARWALRFGGHLITEPGMGKRHSEIWCRLTFGYHGVDVKLYAHIPAAAAKKH